MIPKYLMRERVEEEEDEEWRVWREYPYLNYDKKIHLVAYLC